MLIEFIFNGAHKDIGEQRTKRRSHCDAICLLIEIWSLDRFSSWVLLNQSSVKALSAKIWIFSSSGTLVNKEVTS